MRPASIHRMIASQHQSINSLQKPEGRHEGSSRTTTCCHRHTHTILMRVAPVPSDGMGPHLSLFCPPRPDGCSQGEEGGANRARRECSAHCLQVAGWLWQEGKTNLSHDGLNPAHVPCWWVNNPTLPLGCGWEARKSRHRRIKKRRRFERLAATSQLSLW